MGSVIFTDTHSSAGFASATYDVRLNYSESYNKTTRKSTVKITSIDIRKRENTTIFPTAGVFGSVKINGTTVLSMDGLYTYGCQIGGGGWYAVSNSSSSSVEITHDPTSGGASMTVQVIAGNSGIFGAYAYYSANFTELKAGVPTGSKTVSLITHTSTLSINPDGGIWNGSTSVQTFTQAQGSTKSIANPTKDGYAFARWALSGGGSISEGIYTFGESNGTLIAQWVNAEYTLHITADSGAEVHVTKNGVDLSDGDTIYYNDTLNLSIAARPGYQLESRSPLENSVIVIGDLIVNAVTSPMATIHIRKNGSWGMYLIYIRRNAQWLLHQANIRKNAQWKKYY